MVVVYCIDNVLIILLAYLPHGSSHHVASCIGCYSQPMPLAWGGGGGGGGRGGGGRVKRRRRRRGGEGEEEGEGKEERSN